MERRPHAGAAIGRWAGLLARVAFALAVGYLAFLLRLRSAEILPLDNDEGGYYLSSRVYAAAIEASDWNGIIDGRHGYEHPPLAKLLYAAAIVMWPTPPEIWQHPDIGPPGRILADKPFKTTRIVAATLGATQVLLLTLVHPLAGALLCVNTWHCKYTGQVMMEPLACVFSTLCVFMYVGAIHSRSDGARGRWLAMSSAFLGLTAACKYPYAVVGLAILADWLPRTARAGKRWSDQRAWVDYLRGPLTWGVGAFAVFGAVNPRMWRSPVSRLWESFIYHYHYSRSEHVRQAGEPFYAPAYWLSGFSGKPMEWHPGIFLIQVDHVISVLAVVGIVALWRRERVYAIWLVGTLAFLTVWTTKWPQYLLMVLVPQMMAAALGARLVVVWIARGIWRFVRWQLCLTPEPTAD